MSGRVAVGSFIVEDDHYHNIAREIADQVGGRASPYVAFALHVGGLNSSDDADFIEAMSSADRIYADGMAVVLLARAGGATAITRSPTTHLGHQVLEMAWVC